MYIVMLIEQHVRKFTFVKNENDVIKEGRRLLELRGVSARTWMTGKTPGINRYEEPNRIMYADVFEIRAAKIHAGWTYNILD